MSPTLKNNSDNEEKTNSNVDLNENKSHGGECEMEVVLVTVCSSLSRWLMVMPFKSRLAAFHLIHARNHLQMLAELSWSGSICKGRAGEGVDRRALFF